MQAVLGSVRSSTVSVRKQLLGTDRILAAAWVEQGVPFGLFVERLVGGCKV